MQWELLKNDNNNTDRFQNVQAAMNVLRISTAVSGTSKSAHIRPIPEEALGIACLDIAIKLSGCPRLFEALVSSRALDRTNLSAVWSYR